MLRRKLDKTKRRHLRVRAKVSGNSRRPRLCVYRSSRVLYAQIIDDEARRTIAALDTRKLKGVKNNVSGAEKLGLEIAKISLRKGIKEMVFDRNSYKYHGRVKAFVEAVRKGGIKI